MPGKTLLAYFGLVDHIFGDLGKQLTATPELWVEQLGICGPDPKEGNRWLLSSPALHVQTGIITVNRHLDREQIAEYKLTISVKDNPENPRIARRVSLEDPEKRAGCWGPAGGLAWGQTHRPWSEQGLCLNPSPVSQQGWPPSSPSASK